MKNLPTIPIAGADRNVILIQGGMGIGISLAPLARAVAQRGGVGTISSAGLATLVSKRIGRKVDSYQAAAIEVAEAKENGGFIAINIMVALYQSFTDSILGAIAGGVDALILGAGLPTNLPENVASADVALIPIVSSAKALRIIHRRWTERYDRIPDAVVLEGPLAGGHLGFSHADVSKDAFRLENLFGPVKEFAQKHGDFPVIVAGGVYYHDDILKWVNEFGADGVQLGTRFAATHESGASADFKQAIIDCRREDIIVPKNPGSPCGLPFRLIKTSPGYQIALHKDRPPKCNRGFVLRKDQEGHFTVCSAKDSYDSFCICNVLLSAHGFTDREKPIYTIGQRGYLVDQILSVDELMDELIGLNPPKKD
ncbi:NAD(P)H-dependent flavin oxidoreductase [Desulfobacca acetoxidans]|uniref:2-nitropropane dioxygenase NPD n=1 Tax=Desulfobacca acetoxidans (strain ATCC 700848 / DSM 11109 / ASRB2) TaxID=880072 RepID=F2NJL8_DESAR|nr:nitronate monooxygenase [Desulfobacca acetoxidans]AEB09530.1 2-nitropropane dioxygenase NPD [Desulfobacca acetoxidans DSM 11109]